VWPTYSYRTVRLIIRGRIKCQILISLTAVFPDYSPFFYFISKATSSQTVGASIKNPWPAFFPDPVVESDCQ
jgi:hypothetical protein